MERNLRWLQGLQAVQLEDGATIMEWGKTPRWDLWRMVHSLWASRLQEGSCWFHVLTAVPQTAYPVGSQCFCFHEWVNLNMLWYWFSLDYFQLKIIKNLDSNELEKNKQFIMSWNRECELQGWLVDLVSLCSSAQVTSSPVMGKIGSNSLQSEKIFPTSHPAHFPLFTWSRLGHMRKEAPCNPSAPLWNWDRHSWLQASG